MVVRMSHILYQHVWGGVTKVSPAHVNKLFVVGFDAIHCGDKTLFQDKRF